VQCHKIQLNTHKPTVYTYSHANMGHSAKANSQEVYLGNSNNERQSGMVVETGNTYVSETLHVRYS